jgi:hypothetical protein
MLHKLQVLIYKRIEPIQRDYYIHRDKVQQWSGSWLKQKTKKIIDNELAFEKFFLVAYFVLCVFSSKLEIPDEALSSLRLIAIALVTKVAASIISYCIKSYKETKAEKSNGCNKVTNDEIEENDNSEI